jgi:adenosylcobinamide kinase/adenosylcobinamide-phosphate guanylyltransferase
VGVEPSAQPGLVLVSGPSRSGKSRWAEHLAASSGQPVLYLATGALRPDDARWQQRLDLHRQRRPPHWSTLEVGGNLSAALNQLLDAPPQPLPLLLVDALGTWLAHHLDLSEQAWELECEHLLNTLAQLPLPVVLVCEEVGWGVVPATAIGGLFRDRLGALQQRLMAQSVAAWLVVQGRALDLHALGHAVPLT